MTPEQRAAWLIVLGHVLELLEGTSAQATASAPTADLTVKEIGTRLHRNPSTVRAWCEAGRFPGAYRFERREWRVPAAGLAAFEEAQRTRGTGADKKPPSRRGKVTDLGAWRTAS